MYNRYIFDADGSCRRSQMADAAPGPTEEAAGEPGFFSGPEHAFSGFQGLDTGDLFIVLLLLLMAGDQPEQRDHALLTLALYFIL